VFGIEAGEGLAVAARRQDAAAVERYVARLEAAHALVQVDDPVRLAHLAVVHDVDARLHLPADGVRHDLLQGLGVGGFVVRPAGLLGRQEREQLRGPDQAPGVRGEDPLHLFSLRSRPGFAGPRLCQELRILSTRRLTFAVRGSPCAFAVRGSRFAVMTYDL
jgi:hypothetical protein